MSEWLGSWGVPGGPLETAGLLEITDEKRIELAVLSSLVDFSEIDLAKNFSFPPVSPFQHPVLYGSTGSREITLIGAKCAFPLFPGLSGIERWRADVAIEAHVPAFDGESEPRFKGISFAIDTLPFVAPTRGPDVDLTGPDLNFQVSAEGGELLKASLPGGNSIVIRNLVSHANALGSFELRSSPVVVAHVHEPTTWHDLLREWLQPLQVLLWVLTARASKPTDLHLCVDPTGSSQGRREWAAFHVSLVADHLGESKVTPGDVLLRLADLPGGFDAGANRWWQLWPQLRHVLEPLAARAVAPFVYSNDRFYTAVAAVEAYDRHIEGTVRELERQRHTERVAQVRRLLHEHLPPDVATWASNGLPRFNQLPLWKRILRRLADFPEFSEQLLGDRAETFAKAVERARHGEAHALESRDDFGRDGTLLYMSAEILGWLVHLCVLVNLGVASSEAEAKVLSHPKCMWLAERLRSRLSEI